MKWMEAAGASLRYETTGEGLRWTVMVHEMGGSLETWDRMVPCLQDQRRILRFDMRGAGLSEKVQGHLALETLSDDLAAIMENVRIAQPATVVAASLGCAVALDMAIKRPHLVKSLVLVSPAIERPDMGSSAAFALADAIEEDGVRPYCDQLIDYAYPCTTPTDRDDLEQIKMQFRSNDPRGLGAMYRMMARLDLRQRLAGVRCPTLIIAGTQDPWRKPSDLAALSESIPNCTFALIAAGHYMLYRNAPEVSKIIHEFEAKNGC